MKKRIRFKRIIGRIMFCMVSTLFGTLRLNSITIPKIIKMITRIRINKRLTKIMTLIAMRMMVILHTVQHTLKEQFVVHLMIPLIITYRISLMTMTIQLITQMRITAIIFRILTMMLMTHLHKMKRHPIKKILQWTSTPIRLPSTFRTIPMRMRIPFKRLQWISVYLIRMILKMCSQ